MKVYYEKALAYLIEITTAQRDQFLDTFDKLIDDEGAIINIGDKRYKLYMTMVETGEYRVLKRIEDIACKIITEKKLPMFELKNDPLPNRINLLEKGTRIGILFANYSDLSEIDYLTAFQKYQVDKIKIVLIAAPLNNTFEMVNDFNSRADINLERISIIDFWKTYFGDEELENLFEFVNEANRSLKNIIGFDTVLTPSKDAITKFKAKCGIELSEGEYIEHIPNTVSDKQVERIYDNYFGRKLWRAMIGKSEFALSYITSEWNYTMYELSEHLDLTGVAVGYLKSIEQLLFSLIKISENKGITFLTKDKTIVEYSAKNEQIIDTTLNQLEQVINHNSTKLLIVNNYAKQYLIESINEFRDQQRNKYLHKNNIHLPATIVSIRKKVQNLFFLILGSCEIDDTQLELLGIESQ